MLPAVSCAFAPTPPHGEQWGRQPPGMTQETAGSATTAAPLYPRSNFQGWEWARSGRPRWQRRRSRRRACRSRCSRLPRNCSQPSER
eukprot:6917006-Alexandrium_andersonii.AAC.1